MSGSINTEVVQTPILADGVKRRRLNMTSERGSEKKKARTMKKELITAQQAWDFIKSRRTRNLVGLDICDYIHTFMVGDEKQVLEMTMNTNESQSLPELIAENQKELLLECSGAKQVVMQLYCGNGFRLMMDDLNNIQYFVDALGDTEFSWGLECTETDEYALQVCVFVIK